ncbi:MAG: AraC family transcriptional regulator [Bacteroidetes bacterium]|nr:AraC family transcriptional regulator [Bacteroidota bacterium]
MENIVYNWDLTTFRNYEINFYNLEGHYTFPLHTHQNQWELVYCKRGVFTHRINNREFLQKEGSFFLIRDHDRHELMGRNFDYYNLAFPALWINQISLLPGINPIFLTINEELIPRSISVAPRDRSNLEHSIHSLLSLSGTEEGAISFNHLMFFIFKNYYVKKNEADQNSSLPDWLKETVAWINSNWAIWPEMKDIIEYSCKCPEHFSRSFKFYMGITPSAYLLSLKLKQAAELLVKTNYTISRVCEEAGFQSPNYFHKRFRIYYGQTPGEYRKGNSSLIHG